MHFCGGFFISEGTGMKKVLFFLALCIGSSANAATMCTPDLSTCESCTDGTYSGVSWTATCCGVTVSGIGVNIGAKFGISGYCAHFSYPATNFSEANNEGACTCIMQKPVVATYWPIIYYGTLYDSGLSYDSCAQACADKFFPAAAFGMRSLGALPGCDHNGGHTGGAD